MQTDFIARQPILNLNGEIIGYELLYRSIDNQEAAKFDNEADAGTSVLANMISNFGQDWLLGGKAAFINVAENSLQSEFIELLNPKKTILEITPATTANPTVLKKMQQLKKEGFSFLLDDCALDPSKTDFLPLVNYIKIDIQRTGIIGFKKELDLIQRIDGLKNIPIIAMKVETEIEKQKAHALGVNLFQGYYFEKPQTIISKNISPNILALLQILNLTRQESSVIEIENALKKDVATSLKLLRYINSAGIGLQVEISSFKHAVQILGYKKLVRWILLLLATANPKSSPALAISAVARGRFMEILAEKLHLREHQDHLFITGAFSFLDALLGVSFDQLLPALNLSEHVEDALINQKGIYYPFLMLAIASERSLGEMQSELAAQLGLTEQQVNQALFESISWAESFKL